MSSSHDDVLARAFDAQAERFEKAPVQSDPVALARLVAFADLPAGSAILDAGCGPGLVAEAFLRSGHHVYGVDLSGEMVDRARARCGTAFGTRCWFQAISLYDSSLSRQGPFDAAVSRYVLHHIEDGLAFVKRQVELLRPGGILVLSDHTSDPDPQRSSWHEEIERLRDRSHTRSLPAGAIVDLLAAAGLEHLSLVEEPFTLDFDEWFDRGTPTIKKEALRARLRTEPGVRGYFPRPAAEGPSISIACWRALVRGRKPL